MSGDPLVDWSKWANWLAGERPLASSTTSESEFLLPQSFKRLNDHVYEVCQPKDGETPSVEVAFFHGLQLEYTSDLHITTWLSRDKTKKLWLTWLPEEHTNARILTVSYDASREETDTQGKADMFVICENLITCLTDRRVALGAHGCPVILVGHCLGGLVIKEILVKAKSMLDQDAHHIKNFLTNVKAIFFYATPHLGSQLPSTGRGPREGPLFKIVTPLNRDTQRRNEAFRKLRHDYGWSSTGFGENQKTKLESFTGLIVEEASARFDVDRFYTISADHFDVCRPESTISGNFAQLVDFMTEVLDKVPKASTIQDVSRFYPTSCDHPDVSRAKDKSKCIIQIQCGSERGDEAQGRTHKMELEELVKALTTDSARAQRNGARALAMAQRNGARALAILAGKADHDLNWEIIHDPRVLKELVNGLHKDDDRDLQEDCAMTLANLAYGNSEICQIIGNCRRGIEGLVRVLKEDSGSSHNAQRYSARVLVNLTAKANHHLGWKIINVALEELVQDLSRDDNRDLQEECARALANLAWGDLEMCRKIVNRDGALVGLVRALQRDSGSSPDAQKYSARALLNLAAKMDRDLNLKIIRVSRALGELVNGLDNDDNRDLQEECAGALANLARSDLGISREIRNIGPAVTALRRLASDSQSNENARKFSKSVLRDLKSASSSRLMLKSLVRWLCVI